MTNVLTLRLDADSQAHFEGLRRRYFPPERNQIPAHLTLFHALPDGPEIDEVLEREAEGLGTFPLAVTGVRSLGKGVAYKLASSVLGGLHTRLAAEFADHLTAQDRQRLQPHIVVQNKVTPAEARELLARLSAAFEPREVEACGFDLWRYLGGPWEHAATFSFPGAARD